MEDATGVSEDSQLSPNHGNFLFAPSDHIDTLSFEDESVGMLSIMLKKREIYIYSIYYTKSKMRARVLLQCVRSDDVFL